MKNKITLTLMTIFFLSGCSTPKKSGLLGAGIGASIGLALGSASPTKDSRRNGALIGAALGGLIGYYTKPKKKSNEDTFKGVIIDLPHGLKSDQLPSPPRITKPIVTVKKVERKKIGNDKVRSEGYEWIIKRSCEWVVE